MNRALPSAAALLALLLSWLALWALPPSPAFAACRLSFTVTDVNRADILHREFGTFAAELARQLHCRVSLHPVKSRTAAVEALKRGAVDLALTGPAEYVVIRKLTRARPLVAFSRPNYHAAVLVTAAGGITSLAQLKGKSVVFGDVGSTSGHLAPMQLLADAGLDPLRDVTPQHMGRFNFQAAWQMLKEGRVAAIAFFEKKLLAMVAAEKELPATAFRIIARGPALPDDVLVAGKHLDPELAERVRRVFLTHPVPFIAALLTGEDNRKYLGMRFRTRVKDSDYNYIRRMYRTIGFPAYGEFVGR